MSMRKTGVILLSRNFKKILERRGETIGSFVDKWNFIHLSEYLSSWKKLYILRKNFRKGEGRIIEGCEYIAAMTQIKF